MVGLVSAPNFFPNKPLDGLLALARASAAWKVLGDSASSNSRLKDLDPGGAFIGESSMNDVSSGSLSSLSLDDGEFLRAKARVVWV
ncbi:hypothetical protein WG66_015150 [Moniliophthora roreri]|nr:hypothetical protein WG66_015150 [Moniliophthora roreri]